jgi:hypothetical protein
MAGNCVITCVRMCWPDYTHTHSPVASPPAFMLEKYPRTRLENIQVLYLLAVPTVGVLFSTVFQRFFLYVPVHTHRKKDGGFLQCCGSGSVGKM